MNSPDAVRRAVLDLLTEGGQPSPPSPAEFRRHVSVRRVRARLGSGDTTALSRQINEIEEQLVSATRAQFAIRDLPEDVANLMQGVWRAALASQSREVVRLQQAAAESVELAESARADAAARIELLTLELQRLRLEISARDESVGELRARLAESERQRAQASGEAQAAAGRLAATIRQREQDQREHSASLAEARAQSDGLGRRLRLETDALRQAMKTEKSALEGSLAKATALTQNQETLIRELTADRNRIRKERDASP